MASLLWTAASSIASGFPSSLRQVHFIERVVIEKPGRPDRDAIFQIEIDRGGGKWLADRRGVAFTIGDRNRHPRNLRQQLPRMGRRGLADRLGADHTDRSRHLRQGLGLACAGDHDFLKGGGLRLCQGGPGTTQPGRQGGMKGAGNPIERVANWNDDRNGHVCRQRHHGVDSRS